MRTFFYEIGKTENHGFTTDRSKCDRLAIVDGLYNYGPGVVFNGNKYDVFHTEDELTIGNVIRFVYLKKK